MRQVKRAYSNQPGVRIDNDTYYIFIIPGETKDASKKAFMPRKRQSGFVYTANLPNNSTTEYWATVIAHELGHGAFRLEHHAGASSTTDNLMDYNMGRYLHQYQWNFIHNPVPMIALFQDDEEGAYLAQCLLGAAIDFSIYYSITWVSMFFDDEITTAPDFTDFSAVTNYKEFSWYEAITSALISCGTSSAPFLSSRSNINRLKVGLAAFAGAAEGMATEFAKQYDITSSALEKRKQPNGFSVVVCELDWTPVLMNAGISGATTAFSTYVVTRPQYANLVRKVKQKLKVTNNQFSRELNDYISNRLRVAKGAGKLVDNLNLGKFVKKVGDYDVFENGEVFYRGMSQSDYQYLLTNGKIRSPLNSPTSEVFTSPSLEYIKSVGYGGDGVIVKFKMKPGTLDNLVSNGVRDQSNRAAALFPEMPSTNISGWEANGKVYFKQETIKNTTIKQVNIGLGKNENGGLKLFNGENGSNILEFQIVQ